MKQVDEVVKIFKKGGIVIFPTETVYGVGCLVSNEKSVERLYQIKKRPSDQPSLAVFPNIELVKSFVEFTPSAERLAVEFWPGPLTLVLKAKKSLPRNVLGAGGTFAVRVPSNEWLLKILITLNEPILAPSANLRGNPAPKVYSEIDKEIAKLVDYVVTEEPEGQKPSTIVDLTRVPYKIVREGALSKKELEGQLS